MVPEASTCSLENGNGYLRSMYIQVNPRAHSGELLRSRPAVENVCVEVDKEILRLEQTLTGDACQTMSAATLQNDSSIVSQSSSQARGVPPQSARALTPNSHISDHHLPHQNWATLNPVQHSLSFSKQSPNELQLSHKSKAEIGICVPASLVSVPAKLGNSSLTQQTSSGKSLVASKPIQYLPTMSENGLSHTHVRNNTTSGHQTLVSSHSLRKATISYRPPSQWTDYSVNTSRFVNPVCTTPSLRSSSTVTSPITTTSCSLVTVNVSSPNRSSTTYSEQTKNISRDAASSQSPRKRARVGSHTSQWSAITQRPGQRNTSTSSSSRSLDKTLPSIQSSTKDRSGLNKIKKSKAPTKQGLSSRLSPHLPLASPSFVIPQLPLDSETQERNLQATRCKELPHLGNQPTLGSSLNLFSSTLERGMAQQSHRYVSPTLLGSMHSWSHSSPRPVPNTDPRTKNSMSDKSSVKSGRQMKTSIFQDKASSVSAHHTSSIVSSQRSSRSMSLSPPIFRSKSSTAGAKVPHQSIHTKTGAVMEPEGSQSIKQASANGQPASQALTPSKPCPRYPSFKFQTVTEDAAIAISKDDSQLVNTPVSAESVESSKTAIPVCSAVTLTQAGLSSFYTSSQYKVSILKKIHEFNQIKNNSESKGRSKVDSSSSFGCESDQLTPLAVRDALTVSSSPIPLVVQPAVLFSGNQDVASSSSSVATSPSVHSTNEEGLSAKQALKMSARSPENLSSPTLDVMRSVKPSLMVNAAYVGDFSSMSLWEMEQLYAYNKTALHRQKQLTKLIREQLVKMQQEEKVTQDRKLSNLDLYKRFLRFLVEPKCVLNCDLSSREALPEKQTNIIEGGTFDKPRLKKEYDTYGSAHDKT